MPPPAAFSILQACLWRLSEVLKARCTQDAYMPKDASKAGHRGIGFVTVGSPEALEKAVSTTHTLHGQELAVDRAEPKLAVRHLTSAACSACGICCAVKHPKSVAPETCQLCCRQALPGSARALPGTSIAAWSRARCCRSC